MVNNNETNSGILNIIYFFLAKQLEKSYLKLKCLNEFNNAEIETAHL